MNINIPIRASSKRIDKPGFIIAFGIIFILAGIVTLYFAGRNIADRAYKNDFYVPVTGVVVDYAYSDDMDTQAIIAEYEVDGNTYKKKSNNYSSLLQHIGTTVELKYDPSRPQDAIFAKDSGTIMVPLFGAVFVVMGGIIAFAGIKKMDQAPVSGIDEEYEFEGF